MHRNHIGVSFDHDGEILLLNGLLGEIETVKFAFLAVYLALGGVLVLGHLLVGAQRAASERHDAPRNVVHGEDHAVAEAVVERPVALALQRKSRREEKLLLVTRRQGVLRHPVALRGIVAQVDEHLRFVVVEPRGVVDDRLAVEPLVQIGPGLFRKVLFGDTGHRRMAQTPPRKEILRRTQCCRQREQQNRSLHVCSFFGSSGICPVLNIYGSGGKKFSPRCYFLNVPINFFG